MGMNFTKALVTFFGATLLFSISALAQNASSNFGGIGLSNDAPIQIDTQNMEINDEAATATFTGNVGVKQANTSLNASKMVVFYNKGGSITGGTATFKKIDLVGNVKLRAPNQTATADAGSVNMETEILVLTGKEVVLTEGENVFLGCKLTVQMKTGNARLESCSNSRVIIQLDPKSRQQ